MKMLAILFLSLFAISAFARNINCTTKLVKGRTNKTPSVTWCGAVEVKAFDNGIKYQRQPRFCKKFSVEFFSIKSTDESKFTYYCDKIQSRNCYMIRIKDAASRQGMGNLSSHLVFPSVAKIPTVFNLGASGIGHKRGAIPGPGAISRIDLNCRAS